MEKSSDSIFLYFSPIIERIIEFVDKNAGEFPWAVAAAIRMGVEIIIKTLYIDLLYPRSTLEEKLDMLFVRKLSFRYVVRKLEEKTGNKNLREKAYLLWLTSGKYFSSSNFFIKSITERKDENAIEDVKKMLKELKEVWELSYITEKEGIFSDLK
ncbi:MAG: hypothetical protein J7L38_07780 [Thermoproteales archaeon]|nr:hypothetical protein [Thermoproteales archaeon]